MKKVRRIVIVIVVVALLGGAGYYFSTTETARYYTAKVLEIEFIPNQDFDITTCLSIAEKDSMYADFRESCPFHFQMLGLGTFADSSFLFILSEPPPYVELDSVVSVFQQFNIYSEVKTHPMGYDGWVKDILVCVGKATSENITNLTRKLNEVVFLSDYKSFAMDLPLDTSRIYFSSKDLNYRISLSEVNQWFIEDKEPFFDLKDTAQTFCIPDIFQSQKTGVFYSQLPGFVIWSLDKKEDISTQRTAIRQFALDSDLILGAISDSSSLVIIGRERESDLMELPPLNVESVLLLASIEDGELSQSLDVNDLLAGKMSNNRDWCPTFLSPQLEHTEFGHLLTITDLLLKGWSENGTIHYDEYDYPNPSRYPFDRPLFGKLGLNELVYNWNTANTMFAYDYDGMNLYALNRTGSLPVSYFNPQMNYSSVGHSYENKAYNYFSELCNTDLIRVVQYTSLYQIFMDNDIKNKIDTLDYASSKKPYLLYGSVKKLLTNVRDMDAQLMDSIARKIGKKNYDQFRQAALFKQIDQWEQSNGKLPDGRKEQLVDETLRNSQNAVRNELHSLQWQLKGLDEKSFAQVCQYLSYPRGNWISRSNLQNIYRVAHNTLRTIFSFGKPNLKELGVDLAGVKSYYSNTLKESSSPWMKTPSLFISYNSPRLTGGHNLSSKIRRVNSIDADKAIIASGRPQSVPRDENVKPSQPKTSSSPTSSTPSTAKPVATSVKNPPPKPTPSSPVRSRSDVIPTANRTTRGF
jgi:hypothetical protein